MRHALLPLCLLAASLTPIVWAVDPAKDPAKGLNFFSEKDERGMGEKFARELDGKLRLIRDQDIQGAVERIGARLAAQSPRPIAFRWSVVDTKEVNAFAVPGGFV